MKCHRSSYGATANDAVWGPSYVASYGARRRTRTWKSPRTAPMCQCPRVLVEAKFMKNIDFVISIHDAHIIQRYRNHAGIFIFQKIKSKFNLPTFQYPKQRSKQRANLSAIGAICPLHFLMLCRWTPLAPAEDFYSLCSVPRDQRSTMIPTSIFWGHWLTSQVRSKFDKMTPLEWWRHSDPVTSDWPILV